MSGTTTRYAVPYMTSGDSVATIDEWTLAVAERIDLLAGESGTDTITPSAADATTTKRVNYARSYAALPAVPKAFVVINESVATTQEATVWTTAEDATGFTLNIRASTTGARSVKWTVRPS